MKLITVLLVLYAALVIAQNDALESRVVQTAQGPVRGYKSSDGKLYQFFGIPYATAPTGTKRFTAPLPGPVWMQPFEAVQENIVCPQDPNNFFVRGTKMQENCLIANIHVPDTKETNLPVFVFVHGGGYFMGFGELSSPAPLARSKKVIAVTFNYRVGAHGFLCLGTKDAPGNAGMKDQVALLRWIQTNIANFGGNPNDVTIGGGSAGSSAVSLLMLSDMTKGLYHKVIPESGSSLSAWSIQMDPIKTAKDFLKIIGNETDDMFALEEFYKSANHQDLIFSGIAINPDGSTYWMPCVERDVGAEIFLKEAPMDILKRGRFIKVPVLSGFANMEGLVAIPYFEKRKNKMNENFSDFLPIDLQFSSNEEKQEIAKVIKEFYFGEQPVAENNVQAYIDYYSDIMFTYAQIRTAMLQVEAGSDSVFLYEYTFYSKPAEGVFPDFMNDIRGAGHCYQTNAIYDNNFSEFFIDDDTVNYKNMKNTLRGMWINFITTGKPVPLDSDLPEWPPLSPKRHPYMDLGEKITLKSNLLERRVKFWNSIYERYYRTPLPPKQVLIRGEL